MDEEIIDDLTAMIPYAENLREQRILDVQRHGDQAVQEDLVAAAFDNISVENNPSPTQYTMPYDFSGSLDESWESIAIAPTQNTRRQGENMSTSEELDVIINKAELYHIDLGEEAMLDALKAIKKMVQADSSVSDGEVIDYVDKFLDSIGV